MGKTCACCVFMCTLMFCSTCNSEIRIAPGTLESAESCSEVVLFSTDMEILANVADHDSFTGKRVIILHS